ncbi:MAG: hypothetical protein IPJ00_05155 [Saprospirales bacterium]|nr:hypothetical protein [Saprospirales bacterium]
MLTNNLFRYIAEFNGKVYFAAEDGVHVELWSTDGTADSTFMVKDINEGPEGSACQKFYATDEYLFFIAYDEETGNELWRTDGTEAGTIRLKDIYPGPKAVYTDLAFRMNSAHGTVCCISAPTTDKQIRNCGAATARKRAPGW